MEAQQSNLQDASALNIQLRELEKQLEEQKKVTAAKEDQNNNIVAAKKEQVQQVASLKARLAEVQPASVLHFVVTL